ncbi:uncharacterized protein LOC135376767 [Ornithodoros turicata]|uniref:uncharacterized protein LOC135376767 n=1 Tax=Ornithodoros turicata TaxID=34597 RepID=UPI00313A045D
MPGNHTFSRISCLALHQTLVSLVGKVDDLHLGILVDHQTSSSQDYVAVSDTDDIRNDALLKPYTKTLLVNGVECTVLRDSAATMDVVHPKYVKDSDYLSECAWVRSEALLLKRGCRFADANVMALTRAKARLLADELRYVTTPENSGNDPTDSTCEQDKDVGEAAAEKNDPLLVQPDATTFGKLLEVDRTTLSNSVEKWHSVLKRVLRALCFEHKMEWDLCLPAALFALRTAPHEATGFAPAELVYGRNLRSPLRMVRELWEDQGVYKTVVEYVLNLLNRMGATQDIVEHQLREAQTRAKKYYDRNARLRRFRVGDRVMILRPCRQNRLQVQREGPVEVVTVLSDTNYAVRMNGRRKELRVYHCNLMKPYRERQAIVSMALGSSDEICAEMPLSIGEISSTTVDRVVNVAVDSSQVNEKQLNELRDLLGRFQDVFSDKPGRTSLVSHDIEVESQDAVKCKPYRLSMNEKDILKKEIDKMIELGVIEEGTSDYTSPIILVRAPGKDPRPCVDYRKLNAVTKDLIYPIPNIEERIETVSRAKYISAFHLIRGYWQVPLTETASRYAAFVTPFGTYLPKVMSFGLKNAPFCFSRLMDHVLQGLDTFALPYLDDVAVFSNTWEDHLEHLKTVLQRFRDAGLTVKAEKCQLARGSISYLGHVVGQGARRPADAKIAAVRDFPQPPTKKDIRSFLGLTGYYQRYINRYSEIAAPLTDALRKRAPERVEWDKAREDSFRCLKNALTTEPVLRAPDYHREFLIQCDATASNRGLGVVLSQFVSSSKDLEKGACVSERNDKTESNVLPPSEP